MGTKTELLPKVLPKMIFYVQFNHIKCLVPNCPGAKLSGAKLSWCQIVLVPNCPLLLSWCQIVHFYYLGAKLSPLLSWCQIVRCQIVLQSKSGTIFFISNIYIPKMRQIVHFYYLGAKLSAFI